jgi:hypothetical protein
MQLAMAGSAESIRMATVESSRASCSKMSIQASALVFFIGEYVDQRLSNCLILFIYAARKSINHLIAKKMPVYRHGS